MNHTHLEHAIVAAILSCLGLLLPPVVLACFGPTLCFYFREQGQRTVHLCNGRRITWAITIEACKFWKWSLDAQLDFLMTIPFGVVLFAMTMYFKISV